MWNLLHLLPRKEAKPEEPAVPAPEHWYFCLLRCSDGTLYADIAKDPDQLVKDYNEGVIRASYTTRRLPVFLAMAEEYMHKEDAKGRLFAVQTKSREQKEQLVAAQGLAAVEAVEG